jgi:hypothetical protein
MLRHDVPPGAITIGRPAIGPFSASQVALLQTSPEQAVIAISSADVSRVATRTSDSQESLEYQTARPVLLEGYQSLHIRSATRARHGGRGTAARLCDANRPRSTSARMKLYG